MLVVHSQGSRLPPYEGGSELTEMPFSTTSERINDGDTCVLITKAIPIHTHCYRGTSCLFHCRITTLFYLLLRGQ